MTEQTIAPSSSRDASLFARLRGPALDTHLAPYGIFLLRFTLGIAWIAHALLKTSRGMETTEALFLKNGIPQILAWPVFTMEVVGGLCIVLGLYSRQWLIALFPAIVAVIWIKWPVGWVYSNPGGGYEFPLFWTMTQFGAILLGDGKWAIDKSHSFSGAKH
jgi:putative oxidoreductase